MTEKETKQDVKKKAGIEVIFEFKDSINSLLHYYALYVNLLAELGEKIKGQKPDEMDEAVKQQLVTGCQELRYHATLSYIKYLSVCPLLKISPDTKIGNDYKKIKDSFIIDDETVLSIINKLNAVFMSDIIQDLLRSNKDIVHDIYNNAE